MERNAKIIAENKTTQKLEEHANLGLRAKRNIARMTETFAGIHQGQKLFGATPLIQIRNGSIATPFMIKKLTEKKNAPERNVKDTKDAKINRKVEELVKHGTLKNHTIISIMPVAQITSVEIHRRVTPSGATPLIQTKDGSTAILKKMKVRPPVQKYVQERSAMVTQDAKTILSMEKHARPGTSKSLKNIKITISVQRISAEMEILKTQSGAIPLIKMLDGNTAILLLMIKPMAQKNAPERNAQNTKDDKIKPKVEENVKHGTLKHHTSIKIMHVELRISAETQMVRNQSGATPLIQRKDGSTVNH